MTTDPLSRWDDDDLDAALGEDPLDLPRTPTLRRCGSTTDVGAGPWNGTLACCSRPAGSPDLTVRAGGRNRRSGAPGDDVCHHERTACGALPDATPGGA